MRINLIKLFSILVILLSFTNANSQNAADLQVDILKNAKEAIKLRKLYLLNKQVKDFEDSYLKFKYVDSLIFVISNSNSGELDMGFYNTVSNSVIKEIGTTLEDIEKLGYGQKVNNIEFEDKNYKVTSEQLTYFTFLYLLEIKINSKLKEFKNEEENIVRDPNSFYIGDVITVEGLLNLSVEKAGRWNSTNEFMQPERNKIFYCVLIYLKNIGQETYSYNFLNCSIKDSDGFIYNPSLWGLEPSLSSGYLSSNDIVRGYVTFEIPYNSKELKFIYSLSVFEPTNIVIHLKNNK